MDEVLHHLYYQVLGAFTSTEPLGVRRKGADVGGPRTGGGTPDWRGLG